jgi:hypothetical protein
MSLYPFPVAHLQEPAAPAPAGPPRSTGRDLWLDVLRAGSLWRELARTQPAGEFDGVASWYDPDSGRAAEQAASFSQPYLGDQGLEFDGSDDALLTNAGDLFAVAAGQDFSLYWVAAQVAPADRMLLGRVDGANNQLRVGNSYLIYDGSDVIDSAAQPAAAWSARAVHAVTRIGATYRFYRAGTLVGTATAGASRPLAFNAVGRLFSALWFNGQVAMLLGYLAPHSGDDVAAVSSWAAARHSV